MANDNYKTLRIDLESYEKLREIKFKQNLSYIDILKNCINKEYQNMKEKEGKK